MTLSQLEVLSMTQTGTLFNELTFTGSLFSDFHPILAGKRMEAGRQLYDH